MNENTDPAEHTALLAELGKLALPVLVAKSALYAPSWQPSKVELYTMRRYDDILRRLGASTSGVIRLRVEDANGSLIGHLDYSL